MLPLSVYLVGSLRNPDVPYIGNKLREMGYDVFDDWYGAGPEADDQWQKYEELRGRNYAEALYGEAAQNILEFDRRHLDRCDICVLVLPAGRSGHVELGYMLGQGKLGYVLMVDEPKRWDVMYGLATKVCFTEGELYEQLTVGSTGQSFSSYPGDNVAEGVYLDGKLYTLQPYGSDRQCIPLPLPHVGPHTTGGCCCVQSDNSGC